MVKSEKDLPRVILARECSLGEQRGYAPIPAANCSVCVQAGSSCAVKAWSRDTASYSWMYPCEGLSCYNWRLVGGCSLSAQSEAHKLLRAVSCSHSILSSIHSGWKIKMQLTKSCPQSRRHYAQLPSISRAPESSAVRKKEPMDGSPLTTCLVISSRYCITGKSRFEPLAGSAVWIMPFMRVFQEAPCETFITDRDAVLLASAITVGSLRALK